MAAGIQACSVGRGWQLLLTQGEGYLCIFVSLSCRSRSDRHAIGKSVSSKEEVEILHLLMAVQRGGYFWSYGVFSAVIDICIERLLYVDAVWKLLLLEAKDFNRGWLCRM